MLKVSRLTTYTYQDHTAAFGRLIEDVSFQLGKGEVLAITGESGCGKTTTIMTIMGLIDFLPGIIRGEVILQGGDLLQGLDQVWDLDQNLVAPGFIPGQSSGGQAPALRTVITEKKKNAYTEWKRERQSFLRNNIYGKQISLIFQDPRAHLNPYLSIGKQMEEIFTLHRKELSQPEVKAHMVEWLKDRVRLLDNIRLSGCSDLQKAYKTYSRSLSGGMCQKATIAMALASHPALLIADEPTTGLDLASEQEIINLLAHSREICGNKDLSIILVTHDLKLIRELADRVMVMYAGQIVEEGLADEVFAPDSINHPYTARLRECMETAEADRDGGYKNLPTIEGEAFDPYEKFTSCRFGYRKCCPEMNGQCERFAHPDEFTRLSETHKIKCHNPLSPTL